MHLFLLLKNALALDVPIFQIPNNESISSTYNFWIQLLVFISNLLKPAVVERNIVTSISMLHGCRETINNIAQNFVIPVTFLAFFQIVIHFASISALIKLLVSKTFSNKIMSTQQRRRRRTAKDIISIIIVQSLTRLVC